MAQSLLDSSTGMQGSEREIVSYLPVVRRVVKSVLDRLPHIVDSECLEGAGVVGLLKAFEGYDAGKGVPFEQYARIRIKGAVQDELRSLDHLTRRQRRRVRSIAEAREEIERTTGDHAEDDIIAARAELTMDQLASATTLPMAPQLFDTSVFGEVAAASPWSEPRSIEAQVIEKQRYERLLAALAELPERQQTIMSLYYGEELTLQEIGEMMGVTQSRVSQIISKVKRSLRTKLAEA